MIVIFFPNLSEKYPFVIDPITAPRTVKETINDFYESVIVGKDYLKNNKAPDISNLYLKIFYKNYLTAEFNK